MTLDEWVIMFVLFCILVGAYRLGYTLGNKNTIPKGSGHSERVSNIQAGLMGLLGVMLAFSFSLSSQRFEKRRQLVIQESLNIGTSYFRAGLLPDSLKKDIRILLKKYLDERINYYQSGSTEQRQEFQIKSEDLQVQIWAKTALIGRQSPNLNTNVNILSLNEMIDIGGNIFSDFESQIPGFVFLLLAFISLCTIAILGYSDGLHQEKNLVFAMVLILVLCSILLLILDMDEPTSGLLQIDIYGLNGLKRQILTYDK